MHNLRFFVSWIVSSLAMFSASYWWHGVFLTDFSRINYPLGIFLTVAILVYLLFGFILCKGYTLIILNRFNKNPFTKGLIIGSSMGVVVFCITLVSGLSFNYQITMEVLLLDLFWQIIEQTVGGLSVAAVHYFMMGHRVVYED